MLSNILNEVISIYSFIKAINIAAAIKAAAIFFSLFY